MGEEPITHLLDTFKKYYTVEIDQSGGKYCDISLDYYYRHIWLDINMPNYVKYQLHKYQHKYPKLPVHFPYKAVPKQYGKDVQKPLHEYYSPNILEKQQLRIANIVGSMLYYGMSIDNALLKALNSISQQQNDAT